MFHGGCGPWGLSDILGDSPKPMPVDATDNTCTDTRSVLPECDYVTFRYLLLQIRLSSVTFVRPTQGVETFGNISSPLCSLYLSHPLTSVKILRRSFQGNRFVGDGVVK